MRFLWTFAMAGLALLGQLNPRVQFVEVEPGVRLEVLDWGGEGRPIVLLAGYLTGHAYEPLAARLTGVGHVYSLTRRGMGASSRPEHGYAARQSAEDVLKVIDALQFQTKPILAGHSLGART